MKTDQRQHQRTPIKMTVRLKLGGGKTAIVETWDISDGGIGIQIPNNMDIMWTIDMPVIAQVQGLPVEGPELAMRVARIQHDRIGLQILQQKSG